MLYNRSLKIRVFYRLQISKTNISTLNKATNFHTSVHGNKYREREIFMNHEILNALLCHKSPTSKSTGFDRIDGVERKVVFDRNTNLPDGEKR